MDNLGHFFWSSSVTFFIERWFSLINKDIFVLLKCWSVYYGFIWIWSVSCCSPSIIISLTQFKCDLSGVTSAADTVCQVLCNVRMCKKCETKRRATVFVTLWLCGYFLLFSPVSHLNQFCSYLIHSPNGGPSGTLTLNRPGNKPLTGGIKTVGDKKIKKNCQEKQCGCMTFSTTAKHPRTRLHVKLVFPLPVQCSSWVCFQ